MIRNCGKYLRILFVIGILVPQLHAHYVLETAKNNNENTQTNQLNIQQKPHHHRQQQQAEQLVQHKPIETDDETYTSYVSVRGNEDPVKQHHESYDKNDDDIDDVVYADSDTHADDMFNDHYDVESNGNGNGDDDDEDGDEGQMKNEELNTLKRQRRELSDWFIAPNTRWCGRGNTAEGRYNHLGGASAADKCCRRHDHCKIFIPSMSNRYELFNYRPYTLSHCSCDRRFRTCLKMANDEDAKTIGKLFFNMVPSQCFILHTEKICQKRADDGTCQNEYVKQKAYLRDNKKF